MKLVACYTDSHLPLLEQHFLPSLARHMPAGCSLSLHRMPQRCEGGEYGADGWADAMGLKVDLLMSLALSERDPFIYSDVDVRFYGDCFTDAREMLGDDDLACQNDRVSLSAGFFVVHPGRADTVRLFQRTRELLADEGREQPALNRAIAEAGAHLKVKALPDRYWTHGRIDGVWDGAADVHPPADLLVHHANWCVGVERKLALLDLVADK